MKKLILICGPNGVGKSTLCSSLNQKLINSALVEPDWCRMINPFYYDDEIVSMTISNMTHLLRGYLCCSTIEYVIFNFGFHGPRRNIYNRVMENLEDLQYQFIPIKINCEESENINRMIKDGRSEERINRALAIRGMYDDIEYPMVNTTNLSVGEAAQQVISLVKDIEYKCNDRYREK